MKFLMVVIFILSQASASSEKRLNKMVLSSGIPASDLGIYVFGTDQLVYENQSQKKFIPASLSKMLTAIAALKTSSPDERLKTELRAEAAVEGDRLAGPLYIKGNGDPSFISENMWILVNHLTRTGVKSIAGPIIVDSSLFDDKFFDESRQSLRVDRAYDSPVAALSFNWNTVNVYLRPGKRVGDPLQVTLDPESTYFSLVNKTKTISGQKPADISVDKEANKDGEKIIVTGTMGQQITESVKYASVTFPDMWVGKNLIAFLKQRGIAVENQTVRSQKTPNKTVLLSETAGWTLFEVVDGMLKFSNNFLAEMLTKNIAIKSGQRQGSIAGGVEVVRNILQSEYKLPKTNYDFVSPSGFSNRNKISAKDLGELLISVKKDFSVSSYFMSSLAVPKSEGTLSSRIRNIDEPRFIRAKTGLLSGATSLAGYASNAKGEVFTFVFMYNGSGKESQARDLFDSLVVEITRL